MELLRRGSTVKGSTGAKIVWSLSNYNELELLVDYLIGVHKAAHLEGKTFAPVAIFVDETWRIANLGARADNPAVRIFTEGLQHGVIGVAISQWVAQVGHLVINQSYEYYFFDLSPQDKEILRTNHRLEIPDEDWTGPRTYRYWRWVDGYWFKGDANGVEVAYGEDLGEDVDGTESEQSEEASQEGGTDAGEGQEVPATAPELHPHEEGY